MEISAVLNKLKEADKAYYEDVAEQKLSDDEYDVLKESLPELMAKLKQENAASPILGEVVQYLQKVGETPTTGVWRKAQHPFLMGSLQKVKGVQGIRDWFNKMGAH